MSIDITLLIGMGCTLIGAALGIWKVKKEGDRATIEDATKDTIVATKLDYISKGVDDIRLDIKAQDKRISDLVERVVTVEQSIKSAHHRLGDLEKNK